MSRGKIVGDGAGQYRIGDVLGKGAFSTVYLCTRIIDQQTFAVKVISKNDMRRDAELEDALCREFNSMEVIRRSPFITNMIEKLVSPRNYYIVMDLARGGPLMHVIQQSRQGLHPNRARLYFRQLLMGLTAMHDSNVVHRDIKPENLLLDETKTVLKISDFGFACFSGPNRDLFRRCGTLRYTAPEFYTEESYRGRSVDLWAAGVTLYVMLFNQYPFGRYGDSDVTIIERIRKQEVQFPRKVSGSLEHLMRVMLRKDPTKRWTLEKVKSHAWVMGIDEFTISIPRTAKKPAIGAPKKHNVYKSNVPPQMAGSAGSSQESHSPPFGSSPGGGGGYQAGMVSNSSNLFLYNGSGSCPALGATPADEDQFFVIKSRLLEPTDVRDEDSESEDQEYITGGMHRRVRSCPVLPSVFFTSGVLDVTSHSTSATGTAAGSPIGLADGRAAAGHSAGSGASFHSPTIEGGCRSGNVAADNTTTTFQSFYSLSPGLAGRITTATERQQLAEHLRQERKAQLYRALRLSELHSSTTATSGAAVGGAITGISQSSYVSSSVGGAMPYLTESQLRDTFYSDLPTSPNDAALRGFKQNQQLPQNALPADPSNPTTTRSPRDDDRDEYSASTTATLPPPKADASLSSHPSFGHAGSGSNSSSTLTPPLGGRGSAQNSLTTPPRFFVHQASTTASASAGTARNLSQGTSPSSSSGTKPGDEGATYENRSPENAFPRYLGNGGVSSLTGTPKDTSASTSARRRRIDEREPLYRRLGMAHIKILMNFLFFWITLLVVGALRVLLDVDARKLPLPQRVRDFLERQLAPPFEEEGDSLGVGALGDADASLSSFPATGVHHVRTPSSSVLGAAPSKLRRRGFPTAGASTPHTSSFGILTTKGGARREHPAGDLSGAGSATPRVAVAGVLQQQQQQRTPSHAQEHVTPCTGKPQQLPTPLSCLKLGRSGAASGNEDSGEIISSSPCSSATPLISIAPSPSIPSTTPEKKRSTVQWSPEHQSAVAISNLTDAPPSMQADVVDVLLNAHVTTRGPAMAHQHHHHYDGLGSPPPMGGTQPPNLHGRPAPPAWLQSCAADVARPTTTTTEQPNEGTHADPEQDAGTPPVFERRARELGMRAVASHHENIDDMLDAVDESEDDQ
jgi:serine/threonine protein kinase